MARKISDLRVASFSIAFVVTVLIFLAFSTPFWLRSDPRHYGALFVRMGLWETCFRSFASPDDIFQNKYYVGCRWIFTYEYQNLRHILQPPFFVAVQVFFTFGFTFMLAAIVLLLAQQLCLSYDRTISVFKLISGLFLAAAICSTIAVIVFGAMGDSRHWMPDPDHNYLGWSFGLGVVGTFFMYVAALLFAVEVRVAIRKRVQRSQQVFTLDQTKA